jgi:hypothetical protein
MRIEAGGQISSAGIPGASHMTSQLMSHLARTAAFVVFAIGLVGCDVVSTVTDGFKYKAAVEEDLAKATGVKPQVGFSWNNGRLVQVTVQFPKVYDGQPLGQLAETVRRAVTSEFKQAPESIELSFVISNKGAPTAQSDQPPAHKQNAAL